MLIPTFVVSLSFFAVAKKITYAVRGGVARQVGVSEACDTPPQVPSVCGAATLVAFLVVAGAPWMQALVVACATVELSARNNTERPGAQLAKEHVRQPALVTVQPARPRLRVRVGVVRTLAALRLVRQQARALCTNARSSARLWASRLRRPLQHATKARVATQRAATSVPGGRVRLASPTARQQRQECFRRVSLVPYVRRVMAALC